MKRCIPYLLCLVPLVMGCNQFHKDKNSEVVSERYIHKYGYDVSKQEWESTEYPGQLITTLRNGVTITASYEEGVLHGKTTHTFPHSQTVACLNIYERGVLIQKTSYSLRSIPQKQEVFLSPSHLKLTRWYANGTPMSIEEYHNKDLTEGTYYNKKNEIQFKVVKGSGIRITRDQQEKIALKETMEESNLVKRETFYPNGIPHMVIPLSGGEIHGEKKVYTSLGEPISSETYHQNILNGTATYYQNGYRYLELTYKNGLRHETERYFVDGKTLVEENEWIEGKKHGPSTVYFDGISKVQWYYNNLAVSKDKYRELCEQAENIAIMSDRAKKSHE